MRTTAKTRNKTVGGFDPVAWQSTGIGCAVEIGSDLPADQLARLQEAVGQAAGIPRAIRAGVTVYRTS